MTMYHAVYVVAAMATTLMTLKDTWDVGDANQHHFELPACPLCQEHQSEHRSRVPQAT